jgi:hypothetical protein
MHWIGIGLVAGAGLVVLHWLGHRTDSLGRSRPFPWLGFGFLVVAGLAALTPWFLRARLEARLSEAASQVVGSPVTVFCQSFGEAFIDTGAELGYVAFGPDGVPERETLIKRQQCNDLADYVRSPSDSPTRELAVAVHTLTHEAMHMSGRTGEAETECLAVQRDAEMARLLGATEQGARNLALVYWRNHYPRMPEGYRSAECRPGGAFDIRSAGAPWL